MARTPADLASYAGRTVADLAGPGLKLLFVGINPGLWSAAVDAHFARPGNRFWPALAAAGITDHVIDTSAGLLPADRDQLLARGVGITNVVPRATARADELSPAELRDGAARLESFVAAHCPTVVAVLGLGAYRTAFGRPKATSGRQPDPLADAEVWALPNPSGLNAHATLPTLARDFAAVAQAAGVELTPGS